AQPLLVSPHYLCSSVFICGYSSDRQATRMYSHVDTPRLAPRQVEAQPGRNPAEAARRALERVRKALVDFRPGSPLSPRSLRLALALPQEQPDLETTRL